MTVINASTLQDVLFSGEDPLAPAHGRHVLAAAQVGDKVRLNKIYAGAKVHHARLINGALGAGATVSLGYEFADGSGGDPVAFFNAQAANAAGGNTSNAAPVVIGKDAYIVATIGGAAASGQIDSVLLYEPRGI